MDKTTSPSRPRRTLASMVLLVPLATFMAQDTTAVSTEAPEVLRVDEKVTELDLSFTTNDTGLGAVSTVIETPARLIGLTWEGTPPTTISLRTQDAEGIWSAWRPMEPIDTGADATESTNRRATEPLWVGPDVRAVQFQTTGANEELTAVLLGAPDESTDAADTPNSTKTTDNGVVVNLRDTWDDGCRNPSAEVRLADVRMAVVHHTTGSNTYGSGDVPSLINAICHYHVDALGWDDIGYNFLVDRFGNVWEGRTGGVDVPVQGAHAAGFNSASVGIALMGDHASSQPTSIALQRVGEVAGWKLWLDGVPATGITQVISQGSAKWEAGTVVTLDRISGHRDVQATTCPGDAAFDDLDTITSTAAAEISSLPDRPVASDELLFYRADGLHRYYDVTASAGLNGILRSGTTYTPNWRHITAIDLDGDGQDELLFYRNDGVFRYYDVDTQGKLSLIKAGNTYSSGWSAIVAVDVDGGGQDEILFYRDDDGTFAYYDINAEGELTELIHSGAYAAGWSHITSLDLDGDRQHELLFYRNDGLFVYKDVDSEGILVATLRTGTGFSPNWDEISGVDLDGDDQDEALFYRSDGTFGYYDLDANGYVISVVRSGTTYSEDWSIIEGVDLDG